MKLKRVLQIDPPPLRVDEDGTIRVGSSRVTLDVVVRAYERGETPEQIARNLDALTLANVYAALAYYLGDREGVQSYLKQREEQAAALRSEIEANRPRPLPAKEKLRERWQRRNEGSDAPPAQ